MSSIYVQGCSFCVVGLNFHLGQKYLDVYSKTFTAVQTWCTLRFIMLHTAFYLIRNDNQYVLSVGVLYLVIEKSQMDKYVSPFF